MSRKSKGYTKKNLAKARRARTIEQLNTFPDLSFMYRHTAEMRKMLKGVDLDRFERLAGGG